MKGQWRYSDARIVEVDGKSPGPYLKPSGAPNRTYDYTPKAGAADFDASAWEVVEPTAREARRSTGKVCFNWYRIKVTVPERIASFDPTGSTVAFEIETLTLGQLADDGDALRSHLGYEKVAVLGHSFGGCVALQYALRYPQHVARLLLVGTTAAWDYAEEIVAELHRRSPGADVLTAFLDVPTDDAEFARGQKLVATTLGFHTFDPPRVERLFGSTIWSAAACARSRELMADCNVASRLGDIDVPTLILTGRYDFFCPPSQGARLHRGIRASELVLFERSGHYPFVEEPDRFRAVVRRWLAQRT